MNRPVPTDNSMPTTMVIENPETSGIPAVRSIFSNAINSMGGIMSSTSSDMMS